MSGWHSYRSDLNSDLSIARNALYEGDDTPTMDAPDEAPDLDEPLDEDVGLEQGLIQFRDLLIILQHNGEDVDDTIPPGFIIDPDEYSFGRKPPPLILNLDSTWYLAACLAALLAIHLELDTSWMLNHGYLHYICRIISNVTATVAIALVSTIIYDVLGALVEFIRRKLTQQISEQLQQCLNFTNEQGLRPWYLPREVLDFISSAILSQYDFLFIISIAALNTCGWRLLGSISHKMETMLWLFSDDFFARTLSTSVMSAPGTNEPATLGSLAWEIFPQALLQVIAAAGLCSLSFLFSLKAEEPIIFGANRKEASKLCIFFLLRAAAAHTMTGTTYQLVNTSLAIIERMTEYSQRLGLQLPWGLHVRGVLRIILDQISPAGICHNLLASLLLYGFHVVVGLCCRMATIALWPLWRPFITWLTYFNRHGVSMSWPVYEEIMTEDTSITHWIYKERAIMTLLFGTRSSWPIRTTYH